MKMLAVELGKRPFRDRGNDPNNVVAVRKMSRAKRSVLVETPELHMIGQKQRH